MFPNRLQRQNFFESAQIDIDGDSNSCTAKEVEISSTLISCLGLCKMVLNQHPFPGLGKSGDFILLAADTR